MTDLTNGESLLTAAQLAALVGISVRSVPRFCRDGRLPRPMKLGGRVCRWSRSAVDAHLAASHPESAPAA